MTKNAAQVKIEALKQADRLHELAVKETSADLYDAAGKYYYTAGENKKANACWDVADALRKGDA